MRKAFLIGTFALGLAGCGNGGGGGITPEQAMLLSNYMGTQAAINSAGQAYQSNLMSNYVNSISHIGNNRIAPYSCSYYGGMANCY